MKERDERDGEMLEERALFCSRWRDAGRKGPLVLILGCMVLAIYALTISKSSHVEWGKAT